MPRAIFARRLALLTLCLALAGCPRPDPPPKRYQDQDYLFSFIPPRGWSVTRERTPACLSSVEARHGECRFYVCVGERPEDFLPTSSDFANGELVKEYVASRLKGYNVRCRPTLIQGRRAYEAIYLRNVAGDDGQARLQLVRQTFLARGRLLYTLTFYTFGASPEALKDAIMPCEDEMLRAEATFFLHPVPKGIHP